MSARGALRWASTALALAGIAGGAPAPGAAAPATRHHQAPASVIAVTEGGGFNVFHEDFRTADGQDVVLPSAARSARVVHLPRAGDLTDRIARARRGPLGDLEEDTLYYLAGTRILIYLPRDVDEFDLFADMQHATGTTSAATGRRHGTNPGSLLVYVPASVAGWQWLRHQSWIDAVSASYYTLFAGGQSRCAASRYVAGIVEEGRLVFAAAGNAEQAGIASSPSGAPGAYQVGGVDSEGRPYAPSPGSAAIHGGAPTRPYETGDRMEFPAAAHDAPSGSQAFGGTSGAAPSTAGRATLLIDHARRLLGSTRGGLVAGALARAPRGHPSPARGPLSDGNLTGSELVDVLHHVAVPFAPPSPASYALEGYGALSDGAIERAKRVLEGRATLPARADEDKQHEQWEVLREDVFQRACV